MLSVHGMADKIPNPELLAVQQKAAVLCEGVGGGAGAVLVIMTIS